MSKSDRNLGTDRDITRRDFVNGVVLAARSLALLCASFGLRSGYLFDKETFGADRLFVASPGGGRLRGFTADYVRNMSIPSRPGRIGYTKSIA